MAGRDFAPQGLFYYPGCLPPEEVEEVEAWFESDEFQRDTFDVCPSASTSRKVAHYGYKYNYSAGATSAAKTMAPAPPMPEVLSQLSKLVTDIAGEDIAGEDTAGEDTAGGAAGAGEAGASAAAPALQFNQCIVNRYLPGEGIGKHVDNKGYGPIIACYTFGAAREMEFSKNGDERLTYTVYTEPGSLYVMTGPARYEYAHQMVKRKSDLRNGRRAPRGKTFSVTFRVVP